ncbi:MAG: tRNA-intron lyase, partial [Halobacteria archaeon]
DKVFLSRDAIEELYKSLGYGCPRGENLELSLVEATYLLERDRIKIKQEGKELQFKDFFKIASQLVSDFELKYIVYKDLRERGYYVQPGIADFRLYPRGGKPYEVASEYLVHVISERKSLPLATMVELLNIARGMRKKLLLAIVDEESDLTYYEVGYFQAREGKKREMREIIATEQVEEQATLLEDRVIIWDEELSKKLHYQQFFGKPLDEKRLQLSLVEAAYLIETGELEVRDRKGSNLSLKEFTEFAKKLEPDFERKFLVYRDLRSKGFVVKTGFKFGNHFRVYEEIEKVEDLPHSKYLVHALPADHVFALQDLSRAVRLSQSVRKRMIFAYPRNGDVGYIEIGRAKP